MAGATEIQETAIAFARSAESNMVTTANNAINTVYPTIDDPSDYLSKVVVPGFNAYIAVPADIVLPSITATPPVAPTLNAVTVPTFDNAPSFTMAAPIITIPTAPSAALPTAPGQAPTFNAPSLPAAPTFSLPVAPTFAGVAIPVAPSVPLPTFSSSLPVDDIVEPSATFSFAEVPYTSAMLDALKLKLMQDLSNGGYGIETADELALWERARARELRTAETAIQEGMRQIASRGFSMPSGAANAVIAAAQQSALEKTSSLSRDIALKRADMYVENRKFTIQQVKEVETTLIQYTGQMAERALNASKTFVELSIAVFNAKVARFNVRLETYKAAASVYETLIRGAMLQLEAYKTEVEAARLTVDIQKVHADVYKTQLDGVNALVGLYTAQLGATQTIVSIERAKLDAFKTSVEAYTAQVGAKTAEFGMFEAQIKGETSKIKVYQASTEAYATTVSAYKTKAEISEITLRSQVAANQLKLDSYKVDIARYSSDLEKSHIEMTSSLTKYDADVRKFSVLANATIQVSSENIAAAKANADIANSKAKVLGDYAISKAGVLTEQARAHASINANLAGAFSSLGSASLSSAIGITSSASS